jgi:hypothetical protein
VRPYAVAVNGRVAATGWTLVRGGSEYFTAVLPPDALGAGSTSVQVVPLVS